MPLFMDLHMVPGDTADAVAKAHGKDLKTKENFNCKCISNWVDVDRGRTFCLIDAPNKKAINKLHKKILGVKPLEIVEVNRDTVKSILERVKDPIVQSFDDSVFSDLKIFAKNAFRVIVVTQIMNSRLLQLAYSSEKAEELILTYYKVVKEQLKKHEGREIKGERYLASFKSVFQAVQCALSIQKKLSKPAKQINLRMSIHAGIPAEQSQIFFGDVVRLGKYLCSICEINQIVISPIVRELYKKEYQKLTNTVNTLRPINSSEETFLELLMHTLIENWRNPIFGIDDFCLNMVMSKSELYRKSKTITGMSINELLREYRLQKSLELLENNNCISETAFDSGFSSASYFTKCFHKRFGLQPTSYVNNLV